MTSRQAALRQARAPLTTTNSNSTSLEQSTVRVNGEEVACVGLVCPSWTVAVASGGYHRPPPTTLTVKSVLAAQVSAVVVDGWVAGSDQSVGSGYTVCCAVSVYSMACWCCGV
ncbi:hypothetical protein E2C01_082727 [Portunus trituberculatus]|uniref:Uncharacterized protein n=1 Tax=Portunus trituberculatus TaxID=210409 RepID=A0A5B7J4I9_PORTR|nr:hypothetical protein [Portunus trituberculatus]